MSAKVPPDRPPAATLWFGLLGGAVAWTTAFVVAYLAAETACVRGGPPTLAGVAWLAAAAVSVWAAAGAWRSRARVAYPEGSGRGFLASGGAVLSGLFALVSLVNALPLVVGVGCR